MTRIKTLIAKIRDQIRENEWILAPHRNWYRDVWMFIISGILLWTAIVGLDTSNKGNSTARKANSTAQEANTTARETNLLVHEIQTERYDSTFNNCWDQNDRHNNTIKAFLIQIRYYQKHLPAGQTKADLKRAIEGNIILINAILPRRNCASIAVESVKQK